MDIFHRLLTACMVFCVILSFIPIKYIKQKSRSMVVFMVSMILMIKMTFTHWAASQHRTGPGHLQTDITFCSPVSARYRLQYLCCGYVQPATGLTVVCSATGPAECLKY